MLLKELGTTVALPGTPRRRAGCVRNALTGWGVDLTGMNLVDGSGLDRTNLASCNGFVTVLTQRRPTLTCAPDADHRATRHPGGCLERQPVGRGAPGEDRRSARSSEGSRRCRGTCRSREAATIEFSLLLNAPGSRTTTCRPWSDLVDTLATYPSGPTAAQLAPY